MNRNDPNGTAPQEAQADPPPPAEPNMYEAERIAPVPQTEGEDQ